MDDHDAAVNAAIGPAYPVEVELIGQDSNALNIIGLVARVLRREVSPEAATEYTTAAMDCGSHDELLALTMRTVYVT